MHNYLVFSVQSSHCIGCHPSEICLNLYT